MSTGRVLWIIWCCAWAGMWAVLAAASWPHRVCAEYLLVNPQCMTWGTAGSAWRVVLWAIVAQASLAAIVLPVGKEVDPASAIRLRTPPRAGQDGRYQ